MARPCRIILFAKDSSGRPGYGFCMERVRPNELTAQDIADRTELAGWLSRASFPAARDALLALVLDAEAPQTVVQQVCALPAGRVFTNTGDVWRTLHAAAPSSEQAGERRSS